MLIDVQAHQRLYLRSFHIFGRNRARCDTFLSAQDASQIHASIRWGGRAWTLVDHSRNGTTINGKRLAANIETALKIGHEIRFGLGAAAAWVVDNLDPPSEMLVPADEQLPALSLKRCHLLPDEAAPEAAVYLLPGGQWMWDNGVESVALQDGDVVRVGASEWRFLGSPALAATSDLGQLRCPDPENALFDFSVSQNEEHISLHISNAGNSADLGERTHHYSLLTLARRRLDDAGRGIEAASQGWIDAAQLSRMLGIDQAHLNIQIFRARNQIASALPGEGKLTDVIERRRGELRFGAFPFRIVRGASIEASFNPVLLAAAGSARHARGAAGMS